MDTFSAPVEQEAEDSIPGTQAPATQFAIPSFQALVDSTFTEDESSSLPNIRNRSRQASTFELSLSIWCTNAGTSRPLYTTLLEVMDQLRDDATNKLKNLPKRVDTLKLRIKEQLPLLELRKAPVPLAKEKLPSSVRGKAVPQVPTEDLIFFNPIELFRRILSSQIYSKLHRGLAIFKDTPRELWETDGWASSVRTTCGEYAHITTTGEPVFPSDWIRWQTAEGPCFGRVCAVGRYKMSTVRAGIEENSIVLKVQEGREASDIPAELLSLLDPPLAGHEVLLCSEVIWLPETAIIERVVPSVTIDYLFQDPNNPEAVQSRSSPAYAFVRRMTDSWHAPVSSSNDSDDEQPTITPFFQIPPLRAELELRHYTRSHFVDKFDGKFVLSAPFLTFIDGFGLYRNAYRTLMGWYIIIAALTFEDRSRRINVHPITLGPHGSNLADVAKTLQPFMLALEGGIKLDICGDEVLVCAFSMAYIGDMPQQNKNSGFKGPRANFCCRSCFAGVGQRGNLQFDVGANGRYHWQTVAMRRKMGSLDENTDVKASEYATANGLDEDVPVISILSPALDLIRSTPPDPAHSELQGVAAQTHRLLVAGILKENAKSLYSSMLQKISFPPGFPRIRNPTTHLGSYSIAEHSRWAIIIAPLLRCWLRKRHIRVEFWDAAKGTGNPLFIIIRAFAAQAKTCSILMSPDITALDRANLGSTIVTSRRLYQDLLDIAAKASTLSNRSRRATPTLLARTARQSRSESPGLFALDNAANISKTATDWIRDKDRPNLHTGLHYKALIGEYGTPCNLNVLIGEDKHRLFKKIIYQSNFQHPELFLLEREQLQQTIRLVLADAFNEDDFESHEIIRRVQETCPALFELLVPRSDLTLGGFEDEDEDADDEVGEDQSAVKAIGRVTSEYVTFVWKLPTKATTESMPKAFRAAMREVYQQDFGQNVTHFRGQLHYFNKFAYTDRFVILLIVEKKKKLICF